MKMSSDEVWFEMNPAGVRGDQYKELKAAESLRNAIVPPPANLLRAWMAVNHISVLVSSPVSDRALVVELAPSKSSVLSVARAVIEPVLGPLETTVIVLIVAVFILMQREDLRDRFIRLFGATDLHRTTLAMDDAGLVITADNAGKIQAKFIIEGANGPCTPIFKVAAGTSLQAALD